MRVLLGRENSADVITSNVDDDEIMQSLMSVSVHSGKCMEMHQAYLGLVPEGCPNCTAH